MDLIAPLFLVASVLLAVQALFTLYLMLYAWEHPERLEASRGPRSFMAPTLAFTVLLPARSEEAVIYDTINRIWRANYPKELLEIVVICHADDASTIAEAERAALGLDQVRVETFTGGPINKPRGLNLGFHRSSNAVITIFDAEDDIDPDIFNIANSVMLTEGIGIVQAGVQLMNFRDHWFSIHNCVEYFFWFKSRLHFHASVGMIPLGGNTVFIRRELIDRVGGWDESCLTEDADIGLRLSNLGEPIRVVYDAEHVTREETPDSVTSLVRQRSRWNQGFMQILRKGSWLSLPHFSQRLLAFYTFSYPVVHAAIMLLWPIAIFGGFFLKLPVPVTLVAFLPLYAVFFQLLLTIVGAYLFAHEYGERLPRLMPLWIAVTFLPYQWLLGFAALRAVYRELEILNNWEKTLHLGAHRRDGDRLGSQRGRLSVAMQAIVPRARRIDDPVSFMSLGDVGVAAPLAPRVFAEAAVLPAGIKLGEAALLVSCLLVAVAVPASLPLRLLFVSLVMFAVALRLRYSSLREVSARLMDVGGVRRLRPNPRMMSSAVDGGGKLAWLQNSVGRASTPPPRGAAGIRPLTFGHRGAVLSQQVRVESCGHRVSASAVFCRRCGDRLLPLANTDKRPRLLRPRVRGLARWGLMDLLVGLLIWIAVAVVANVAPPPVERLLSSDGAEQTAQAAADPAVDDASANRRRR